MITVAIPCIDRVKVVQHCLSLLKENSISDIDILIIDNGSSQDLGLDKFNIRIVRNAENIGMIRSLEQARDESDSDILVYMHNDVYIQEYGWDQRVEQAFSEIPDLGLLGFFGSLGVHPDGGRDQCYSNMIGKDGGSNWAAHGDHTTELLPASMLDGLCMIFRREALLNVGIPLHYPPHHWYDRIIPIAFIGNGWKVGILGIAFDHDHIDNTVGTKQYQESSIRWLEEHNAFIPAAGVDDSIYTYGLNLFRMEVGNALPLYVDKDTWKYKWKDYESGRVFYERVQDELIQRASSILLEDS